MSIFCFYDKDYCDYWEHEDSCKFFDIFDRQLLDFVDDGSTGDFLNYPSE